VKKYRKRNAKYGEGINPEDAADVKSDGNIIGGTAHAFERIH
jgi:hypothetical protein